MRTQLLEALERRANHRGLVLAHEQALGRELRWSPMLLRRKLAALERAHAVEILSPLPFLVLRLASWSGKSQPLPSRRVQSRPSREAPIDARGFSSTGVDGGAGEGEGAREALLCEMLEALGESDARPFVPVLDHYSPSLIRSALRRVARTPSEKIRTSRAALFRFLLVRLSR